MTGESEAKSQELVAATQYSQSLKAGLEAKSLELVAATQYSQSLKAELEAKSLELATATQYSQSLTAEVEAKSLELAAATQYSQFLKAKVKTQSIELITATQYSQSLEQMNVQKDMEYHELQRLEIQLRAETTELNNELAVIRHSLLFRGVILPLWSVRGWILPEGSRREVAYHKLRRS